MIEITDRIALNETEIVVTFIRAGGPDGQNMNKVSSASQLRFDVRRSPSVPTIGLLCAETRGYRLVCMIRQATIEHPVRKPRGQPLARSSD
jgi:hypothetical protein